LSITLRPAGDHDENFLRDLYATTRQEEIAYLPWTPEAKLDFVRMQFDAQRRHYNATYPNADQSIVLVAGAPAGRFYVDRQDTQVLIVDLTLLPEFHRRGIGSALVSTLQREAGSSGKSITGHVERRNPAQIFWRQLGFEVTPADDMYFRILWVSSSISRATT